MRQTNSASKQKAITNYPIKWEKRIWFPPGLFFSNGLIQEEAWLEADSEAGGGIFKVYYQK